MPPANAFCMRRRSGANGCGACGGTRSRVGLSIQCRSGGGFAVSKQPHVAIVISTTADTPELALSADWRTALDPGLAPRRMSANHPLLPISARYRIGRRRPESTSAAEAGGPTHPYKGVVVGSVEGELVHSPRLVAWPILFKGLALESSREAIDVLTVEVEAEPGCDLASASPQRLA
jgi:hypothetical protein